MVSGSDKVIFSKMLNLLGANEIVLRYIKKAFRLVILIYCDELNSSIFSIGHYTNKLLSFDLIIIL